MKARHLRKQNRSTIKLASAIALVLVSVPLVGQAASRFIDVPSDNPLAADIEWLEAWGITKGCTATEFCPNDPVTREQMAASFTASLLRERPAVRGRREPRVRLAQRDLPVLLDFRVTLGRPGRRVTLGRPGRRVRWDPPVLSGRRDRARTT